MAAMMLCRVKAGIEQVEPDGATCFACKEPIYLKQWSFVSYLVPIETGNETTRLVLSKYSFCDACNSARNE